jgi:tagatose 1,6-diphosphate aldolase GatY/KbaY
MAEAIRRVFAENPKENDPRNYMGAAKAAVTEVVREKIRLCGGTGLADRV